MTSSSRSLGTLFDTFEREAFRLEILAHYNIPRAADDLRAFLAGEPQPEDYNQEWVDTVRAATNSGKRMYRVHILSRPLTPYLRFELGWGYQKNATAGEEFFILDTTEKPNPLEEAPDFWFFDTATPAVMNYAEDGSFLGADVLPDDRAGEFRSYRDTAMAHATPFPEWWAKYGE
ncbi:DUF6879 family protein [Streptomyces sp. NPDC002577]